MRMHFLAIFHTLCPFSAATLLISLVFFGQPFFDSYFILIWFFRVLRSTFRSILAMPSPTFQLTCFSIFLLWFFALGSSVPQPQISQTFQTSPSSPSSLSSLSPQSPRSCFVGTVALIPTRLSPPLSLPSLLLPLSFYCPYFRSGSGFSFGISTTHTVVISTTRTGIKKGVSPSGETPLFDRVETIRIPKTSMRRTRS